MDNTAQNNQINDQPAQLGQQDQALPQIQNIQPDSQPLQPRQPLAQAQQGPLPQMQPIVPVASSLNKEKGGSAFSEVVKPSEEEIKVEEELKNIGIAANSDKPKLDEIHEQIGVKASLESTPVPVTPTNNIVLPLTEDEVDKTLKTKQVRFHLQENMGEHAGEYTEDSLPFLAMLVKKIIQVHKKIFGKTI
jgi:hypothetical protein